MAGIANRGMAGIGFIVLHIADADGASVSAGAIVGRNDRGEIPLVVMAGAA